MTRLDWMGLALAGGAFVLSACGGSPNAPAPVAQDKPPAAAPAASGAATPAPEHPSEQAEGAQVPDPTRATGAVPGVPAPTNTAPIVAVANYFTEFQGIELSALKPRQREAFLQRVNSELCTCGCKNDTLARCYVNDPRCPAVKGMVQKVYEEVKASK
jgi:hypothetical protein